jgi:hypothetical protein
MSERKLFLPTARQTNWLLIVGFGALGYALYLRYMAIEQTTVGLACDAGLATWLCTTRRLANLLVAYSAFGWAALVLAVLNLLRPSVPLLAVGIAAAAFGVVLYAGGLAGLAVGLLIASFARPQARAASPPAPAG